MPLQDAIWSEAHASLRVIFTNYLLVCDPGLICDHPVYPSSWNLLTTDHVKRNVVGDNARQGVTPDGVLEKPECDISTLKRLKKKMLFNLRYFQRSNMFICYFQRSNMFTEFHLPLASAVS